MSWKTFINHIGRGRVFLALSALLGVAIVFGGASRQHELRLALVELSAIPLLALGLMALMRQNRFRSHGLALSILACLIALPLAQLVLLPPNVWTNLPGRAELLLALEVSNAPIGWMPLSLTPDRTWYATLALLPPVAAFVGTVATRPERHPHVIYVLLLATFASVLLGTAQMASRGEQLYPWTTTAVGSVVGFFANRNHLATLCLVALPFAGALAGRALRRGRSNDRLFFWVSVLFIATMVITLGAIRSRAGIALGGPVLLGTLLITWSATGRVKPNPRLLLLTGGMAVGLVVVALYALPPILARFDTAGAREGRFENWPTVIEGANKYLPIGSGIGSFDAVYRSVEPLERLDSTFFNQAHNDYLEIWLEAGWPGIALVLGFLIWLVRRGYAAWCARPSTASDLQRAASVAIGAVLLHSVADYPLRTAALVTVFAICCAILELAGRREGHRPDPV